MFVEKDLTTSEQNTSKWSDGVWGREKGRGDDRRFPIEDGSGGNPVRICMVRLGGGMSSEKTLDGRSGGKLIGQLIPSGGNCSSKITSGSRRRRSCKVGSLSTIFR